jgi:hypothetical protein
MQRPRLRNKVGAGVLALAGAWAPAAAQRGGPPDAGDPIARQGRPIVVLESHVGQRLANADAILAPLLDELEQRGFAARPASILDQVGGRAPRPGVLDPGTTAAAITQPAESGYEAYARGRFAEAQGALKLAIARIHRNPALLVLDTNNLEATFKILVALALSQTRRGDTGDSVATMIELYRTFRSQPITRADYGPDAEQFYRAVGRQVQAMDRGQLAIRATSEQAVIFVDGQIRGVGHASLGDLIPGIYRVFVQVPATAGRQYEVAVTAGHRAALHVDWELDSSLWLTDTWAGFVFATEAERARQAGFAGVLARRWGGELVAVVGMTQRRGKPAITGQLYDATGRVVRGAEVVLDGADEPRLRALARFLTEGVAGDGVRVDPGGPVLGGAPPDSGVAVRLVPRVLVGAGAAALVTGGVLYAIDRDPGAATSAARNTAPAGIAVGAVGLAAVSVGLWLWGARGSAPMLAIGSSGGFIGWGGEL